MKPQLIEYAGLRWRFFIFKRKDGSRTKGLSGQIFTLGGFNCVQNAPLS